MVCNHCIPTIKMSLLSEFLCRNAVHSAVYYHMTMLQNCNGNTRVCQVGCIHKLIPANSKHKYIMENTISTCTLCTYKRENFADQKMTITVTPSHST